MTVVGQQRGFLPQLADNVYEAGSAMLSFSGVRFRSAAAVFFSFRNAFPSLSQLWMTAELFRLRLLCKVCRLVSHLDVGWEPLLRVAGCSGPPAG